MASVTSRGISKLDMLAGVIFFLVAAVSQSDENPVLLIMVGFHDAEEESFETYACVRAGISDLNATVHTVWRERRPRSEDALDMAKSIAGAHQSLAVFWKADHQLFLYVPQLRTEELLVRPIGASQKEGAADTVGLIVRGALSSLLSAAPVPPAPMFTAMPEIHAATGDEREAIAQEEDEVTNGNEEPTPEASPEGATNVESSRPLPATHRRFLGEVLYGLDSVSSSSPAVHSGRFTFGVRLVPRLFITADFSVSVPIRVTSGRSQGELQLNRYPFSLGVRAYLFEKGRWQLGVGALVETNLIQETLVPAEDIQMSSRQEELKTQVSLVPTGYAAVRLAGTLFAGLQLGMRVLLWEKTDYFESIEGEKALLYAPWRVQLRLSVGMKIFFL